MEMVDSVITHASGLLPVLGTIAVVLGGLALFNRVLKRRWQDNPEAQFQFQLIMLALTFAGILAVIIALPVSEETRGQLLSLIGILLSAAIALSSTTFIGNIMAGIMLKVVKSARPGDFITVADLNGRITEMDLLHTEIQTEFRDLVTVPNLYLVTQPLKVVRASGTIISAEVSLGYEVSREIVAGILVKAASQAGLKDGFVHVRELGDFSVNYRVAGLLEDVKSLISARSSLREAMLDTLHEADIEIVSPNFMNTRAISNETRFISKPPYASHQRVRTSAEDVVFDKAEEAAQIEDIRKSIELTDTELAALADRDSDTDAALKIQLETKKSQLIEQLKAGEEQQKAAESENQSDPEK